jgi:small nuclear ribonucleoprotein D3
MSIGVPVKLFHESVGLTVTCELKTGEVFRGQLVHAEDNMNCQITNVHYTARDGRSSELEHIFIRGSKIRLLILPDMLRNAPMFKRVDGKAPKGRGIGIGRIRAQKQIGKRGLNQGKNLFCKKSLAGGLGGRGGRGTRPPNR